MDKSEAVRKMVGEFAAIPQEWVKTVAESKSEYVNLPMWGTMFVVDDFYGEKLMENSRLMAGSAEEVVDNFERYSEAEQEMLEPLVNALGKSPDWDGAVGLEDFIEEEMSGEHCILDSGGRTTAAYIYEIDGRYVIGVDGAGWNFYDGVWDRIYDVMGLNWHDEEQSPQPAK